MCQIKDLSPAMNLGTTGDFEKYTSPTSSTTEQDYKRKPNFTDMEKLYLLQQYTINKHVLSSKLCDGATTRQKQNVWKQIAIGLSQQNPSVERTAKEVKKKWENLATLARKEIAEFRSGTGRSLLRPPSALTLKILELIDDISYNPPSSHDGIYVKEELWGDEDVNNADVNESVPSPFSSVQSCRDSTPIPLVVEPEACSSAKATATISTDISSPYDSSLKSTARSTFVLSSGYSLKRSSISPNNLDDAAEMTALKKRKMYLEVEKLELEKEKLKLEVEILRSKLSETKHGLKMNGHF